MRRAPQSNAPADAAARRQVKPVICYSVDQVPALRCGVLCEGETEPDQGRRDHRAAARGSSLRRARRPSLPHRQHRGTAGRRPQPVERARPVGALLQRQDARAARHPRLDRRPPVEHAAGPAPARHHHARHARLVRLGRIRRRHSRRDRHALRPLHQPPAEGHRVPPLLPFQPDARAGLAQEACRCPSPRRTCTTCSTSSCAPASRSTRTSIS